MTLKTNKIFILFIAEYFFATFRFIFRLHFREENFELGWICDVMCQDCSVASIS